MAIQVQLLVQVQLSSYSSTLNFQVQDQVADDVKVIYSNSRNSQNLYTPPVYSPPPPP